MTASVSVNTTIQFESQIYPTENEISFSLLTCTLCFESMFARLIVPSPRQSISSDPTASSTVLLESFSSDPCLVSDLSLSTVIVARVSQIRVTVLWTDWFVLCLIMPPSWTRFLPRFSRCLEIAFASNTCYTFSKSLNLFCLWILKTIFSFVFRIFAKITFDIQAFSGVSSIEWAVLPAMIIGTVTELGLFPWELSGLNWFPFLI